MAAYGRAYDELIGLPYSRFEDLWRAYSTRAALDRLDQEVARQRSVVQGAMAESSEIEAALAELSAKAEESKQLILHPERLYEEQPAAVDTPWGEFRTDKWWETPRDTAAEETPVSEDPPVPGRTEDDLGLGLEDKGRNPLELTDVIEWED